MVGEVVYLDRQVKWLPAYLSFCCLLLPPLLKVLLQFHPRFLQQVLDVLNLCLQARQLAIQLLETVSNVGVVHYFLGQTLYTVSHYLFHCSLCVAISGKASGQENTTLQKTLVGTEP